MVIITIKIQPNEQGRVYAEALCKTGPEGVPMEEAIAVERIFNAINNTKGVDHSTIEGSSYIREVRPPDLEDQS